MVNILTDSTSDLQPELAAQRRIRVIPTYVCIAGKTYQDWIGITPADLYRLVEETGSFPTTATPSVEEFAREFDLPGESLYIGLAGKLSALTRVAAMATQAMPAARVRIIDSLSVSVGMIQLALRAADLRDAGQSAAQIEADLNAVAPRNRVVFFVDTLEYLRRSGRLSSMQSFVGSVLSIRPVIEVRPDGSLGVMEKCRGSRARAMQRLLDDFRSNLDRMERRRVLIAQEGCLEDAEYLREEIRRLASPDEVLIAPVGCVLASHAGPRVIGICYMRTG
jgi:DegV family protein with EDD domain